MRRGSFLQHTSNSTKNTVYHCRNVRLRSLRVCHEFNDYIFPGHHIGQGLGGDAMIEVVRTLPLNLGEVTVHGFRSTFRDWAADRTSFANEVCEAALAHAVKGKTEAAYRRGDLFEKRVRLMEAWGAYCATESARAESVVPIRATP